MDDNSLRTWIEQARAGGLNNAQMREALVQQGWTAEQINQFLPSSPTQVSTTSDNELPADGTNTKGMSTKILLAIVIILLVGGWVVLSMAKGLFPATLFNNKEKRFIQASAELTCYQFTNKYRPIDFLALRNAGTPADPETVKDAYKKVADFSEKNAKKFGFQSANDIGQFAASYIKDGDSTKYQTLMTKASKAANEKCGATDASGIPQ